MPEQTEIKDKNGSSYMGTIVWLLQGETWPNTHEQLTLNTLVFAAHVAAALLFQAAVGIHFYHCIHEQLTLNTLVFAAHVAATLLFQAAVGRNLYHHTVRTLIWWRLCCLAVCD